MDKSLAPSFVRITYTGPSGVHHAIIPVNIEDGWVAGVEPNLLSKDGSSVTATDGITGYVDAWKNMLATTQTIGLAEVYAVDADTGEGTFVWGFNLGSAGVGVSPAVALAMATLSVKLINGKGFRSTAMEGFTTVNLKLTPPFSPTSGVGLLTAYLISEASIVYGRGNSYPFAPIALTSKTSDALRSREGLA